MTGFPSQGLGSLPSKPLRQKDDRIQACHFLYTYHYLPFHGTVYTSSQDSAVTKTERPLSPLEDYMLGMYV